MEFVKTEEVKMVLEVTGSEPVYDTAKDGSPVYVGQKVHFAPVVVSQAEYLRLAALPPYAVPVVLREA